MTSKVLSFTIIFVTILYIGIQGLYAQPPVKYIVYRVSVNVMQFKGGTKALVKKGQVIDDKTILDIPAGGSVQIIDKKNKIVLELTGKVKNKLSILVKNVEKRTSLTGKFLTFLKEGIIEKSSDSSMHEQKAGTIFRDDDMLIENDTVEMDSIIID